MIFQTFDNDISGIIYKIGLFSKSFDKIINNVNKRKNDIEEIIKTNGYDSKAAKQQAGSIWSYIFPKKLIDDSLLTQFEMFKEKFNSTTLSAEALAEEMSDIDTSIVAYAKTQKNGHLTTEGFTKSLQGMTLGAKAATIGIKALSIASNMAIFFVISKSIEFAVKGIDNWIHRVEKSNEAMETAISNFHSAQSELDNINSELEEQDKRIDKLQSKGKLTYAEQGELEELKKISKELLIQQDIQTRRTEQASKEAAEKTVNAYDTQYGKFDITKDDLQEKFDHAEWSGISPIAENENDVTGNIAAYIKSTELLSEAQEKYNKAVVNGEITKWLDNDVQYYIDMVEDYENLINNNISDLQDKRIALEDEYSIAVKKRSSGISPLTSDEKDTIETYEAIANAIHLIYEYTNQTDWNSMEIENILNSKGIEKTKDELIAMAKTGELAPETIGGYTNLNKAIMDSEIFLKNGQTAAEAFCDEIYACAESGVKLDDSINGKFGVFTLDESQSKAIDDFQSKVKTLSAAITSLHNGNKVDMADLIQEFPALMTETGNLEEALNHLIDNELKMLLDILGKDTPHNLSEALINLATDAKNTGKNLSDAFSSIQSSYDLMEVFKKEMSEGFTDSTLSSVAGLSDELNTSVAGFYAGVLTADELFSALSNHYQTDIENYGNALIAKNQYSEEFYNTIGLNNAELCNSFKEDYGIDISNCKNYNQAKTEIEKQTLQTISDMWSKYYNTQSKSFTDAYYALEDDIFSGAAGNNPEALKLYHNLKAEAATYEAAANRLDGIVYTGTSANFNKISSGLDKNKSASKNGQEEHPKEFNWLKTREEYLQKEHDNIQKILDDETKSYEEQLDAIDNLIAKNKERLDFFTNALATFQEKWAAASAKLSNEDISNIMHGNDYIGDYTGQYASDVQDAADIYREMISYEEEIADLTQENNDRIREQLKLREEIIQSQQDEIKAQMDLQQSRIDLIEAQGGVVTERMLKNQIQLSENLIDSYKDKIDSLYDQISEVAPDSADYYSLMAEIDACERAIINCKIQQEEWNERIMRLPIERIQKYLNMLAGIKQDLQNFLDEQSAMGIQPSADQLQQLFDISREEIKSLLEQQEKLKDLLEQYKFGSEKFNDVSQELQDIDNTISGLIQSQKEWNASILQIPIDQMSKLNDTLNLVSSSLDNLLSDYDSALSAVTSVIDKQTESLEKLKSAADESYQDKIAPLREELDLLQKQNEERQTEIDLEQKQYHLDKARSQKTNQVVRNGEIIYEADADAIRTANQELSDAEYNKLVKDLGNQISELEEERDKLLESYDTQIEKLNEIKEKWSSIVDEMKLASDISKADKVLGQGWQDKILNGNDDGIYELFKGLYENTTSQKSQLEEQTASNERIAEMMNQFVTRYQEGSLSYEQAMAGIRELSEQMKDGYSSLEQLDALLNLHGVDDLESLLQNMQTDANTSTDQLSKYMELVKANADAMNQYASSWEDMQKNIRDQIAALEKLAEEAAKAVDIMKKHDSNNRIESVIGSGGPNVNDNHYVSSGPGHTAEALADAIAGGKEILEYHTGGLVGAKEAPSRYIGLLSSKNLSDNEVYGKLLKHEWVLTEEQQKIFDSNIKSLLNANHTPRINVSSGFPNVTSAKPNITINMGDTILEHVTKPDEFAHALAAQFKPLLRQEMSKL